MAGSRWLYGLAALILPAGVIGGAVSVLAQPVPFELSERALELDARLAAERPELVLVGNSLVGEGVDVEALKAALGGPRMSVMWEAGTRPANWYAMLNNRLFANGHTPHAVVVVTTPEMLLQTGNLTEKAQESLIEHMGEYEPVINAKVYGTDSEGSLFLQRLQGSRADAQEAARVKVRDATVGIIFGGEGPVMERGEALAEESMAEVFGGEGDVDMSLHKRVIPVLQEEDEGARARADTVGPADSFVPDIVALAQEHGSRVVFVWIPISPGLNEGAAPEPEVTAELLAILNEAGAGWVDLHDLGLKRTQFKDTAHLNSEGRTIFTDALGEALVDIGLMGDAALPAARAPLVLKPEVSREGTPPGPRALEVTPSRKSDCGLRAAAPEYAAISMETLRNERLGAVSPLVVTRDGEPLKRGLRWQEVEAECGAGTYLHRAPGISIAKEASGDHTYTLTLDEAIPVRVLADEGWWIYPGTSLRFDFDQRPEGGAAHLAVHTFGEGTISATAAEATLALAPAGRWLSGEQPISGSGPWSVVITSPAGGPFAVVRRLAIEDSGELVDVVGDEAAVAPAQALFATGRWSDDFLTRGRPLALRALEVESQRKLGVSPLTELADLTNAAVAEKALCVFCSPLVLLEDGEPLPWPSSDCTPLEEKLSKGRYCIADGEARFVATDASNPARNGRDYTVARNAKRSNEYGWWVYPGDVQRYPLPNQAVRSLLGGGRSLILRGAMASGEDGGAVTLTLWSKGEALEVLTLTADQFEDERAVLSLQRPILASMLDVSLEISSPQKAPYLLIRDIAVSE